MVHVAFEMATEDSTASTAVTVMTAVTVVTKILADCRVKPDADQADCHHGNN
jgi:hypothetical protein